MKYFGGFYDYMYICNFDKHFYLAHINIEIYTQKMKTNFLIRIIYWRKTLFKLKF